MQEEIRLANSINHHLYKDFFTFIKRMANRISVGHFRYGLPHEDKKYMTRMELEVKEYRKTGNLEQLYNIANYCWLESVKPENSKFHYNDKANSVTRK